MGSKFIGLVAAGVVLVAGCTPSEAPKPAAPPPPAKPDGEVIIAQRGGFIPEGVEYDQANGRFLTGSLSEGTIFEIKRDGSLAPFVTDADLKSTVGIEVDEAHDRLLVTNSDRAAFQPGNVGQAKLGVYSLTTRERLAMVDLAAVIGTPNNPPQYFANDLTVDGSGTVYVTDTMTNVVYKVTPDYQASVLHRFTGLPQGVQVNGIVYHDGGYLLVVANEHIYKVPVANPDATSEVKVSEPVPGQDGAVWAADGRLVVISNSADAPRAVALTSSDDWVTASRAAIATLVGQATTAAAVGNEIWAVHPHFGDADRPSLEQAVFK